MKFNSTWLIIFSFLSFWGGSAAAQTYCSPAFTTGCSVGDQIQNVSTQNGIVNFSNLGSGCSPGNYTYYSSMTVSEQIGGTFDITVQAGSSWSQGFRIWIDWNQDGDFADPGEDMWNSGGSSTAPYTTTLTVPASAIPGTTRLRVRCSFASIPTDPCASQSFGEVEDYNMNVISPSAKDIGFVRLPDPMGPPKCYTTTETVKARVKNTGTLALSFLTDPLTVTVNVAGPNPVTLTQTVNTGLLAVGDSMDVTLSTTYDMTAPGTYVFTGFATQTNDSNQYNDTLVPAVTITHNPALGTVSTGSNQVCNGNSAIITLTGQTGTFVWQFNSSGTWVTTTNSSNPLTVTPTSNTSYRALICGVNTTNQVTINVITPNPPSVTHDTRCGYGPVNLAAAGTGSLAWFNSPTGGAPLDTGTTYVPTVGQTDTFYVENQVYGSAGTAGLIFNSSSSGAATNGNGLEFTVNNTVVIDSVAVYAIATSGTHALVNVAIYDAMTGTEVFSSGLDSVPALGGKGWVKLGNLLTPGLYRMTLKAFSNATVIYLDNNPGTFPYTATTGDLTITGGWNGSAFSPNYYYFYDWRIHSVCTSTRSQVYAIVNPTAPVNLTASDYTACAGDTITLTTTSANPGYQYTYSPAATLMSTTGSTVQAVPNSNVSYIVSAIDASNCTAYDTVSISVTTMLPSVPTAVDNSICNGNNTQFSVSNSATSGYAYSWTPTTGLNNPAISNPVASPTTGSTPTTINYVVTATHTASGCTQSNGLTLTVNPSTSINLGPDDTVCQYSTVIIDAGSNYNTYKWNNGEIGQVRIINNIPYTQTVTVTVTNQYGCSAADTKKYVVVPRPTVNIGPNQNICVNHTATLTAPSNYDSYLWNTGDTTSTITVGPNATTGNYYVVVTNSFGCTNSDTALITILPCTGVEEYTESSQVNVYPNPNDGKFFVEILSPAESDASLQVINMQGQVISDQKIHISSGFKQELDITELPAGLYFVRITGSEINAVKRVIVR